MNRDDMNPDEQWEDIVRRLRGTAGQARSEPAGEETTPSETPQQPLPAPGPRDYTVADEIAEDFQPPEPKPLATGNPRTILSWAGVLGAAIVWILAALLSWHLPWWLSIVTILGFVAGAISLFFLLPKTWAHRNFFDDDDYGDGAKV